MAAFIYLFIAGTAGELLAFATGSIWFWLIMAFYLIVSGQDYQGDEWVGVGGGQTMVEGSEPGAVSLTPRGILSTKIKHPPHLHYGLTFKEWTWQHLLEIKLARSSRSDLSFKAKRKFFTSVTYKKWPLKDIWKHSESCSTDGEMYSRTGTMEVTIPVAVTMWPHTTWCPGLTAWSLPNLSFEVKVGCGFC